MDGQIRHSRITAMGIWGWVGCCGSEHYLVRPLERHEWVLDSSPQVENKMKKKRTQLLIGGVVLYALWIAPVPTLGEILPGRTQNIPAGDRTQDPWVRSPVLCPLSYEDALSSTGFEPATFGVGVRHAVRCATMSTVKHEVSVATSFVRWAVGQVDRQRGYVHPKKWPPHAQST